MYVLLKFSFLLVLDTVTMNFLYHTGLVDPSRSPNYTQNYGKQYYRTSTLRHERIKVNLKNLTIYLYTCEITEIVEI